MPDAQNIPPAPRPSARLNWELRKRMANRFFPLENPRHSWLERPFFARVSVDNLDESRCQAMFGR
jgi:hypothetical protein